MPSVHIIGGGVAGFTLARELIARGYAGSIRMSDPDGLPYDRPPLSKSLTREYFVPLRWFEEHQVGIVQETASDIQTPTGEHDWVVLATGTTPRMLDVPGAHHARSLHTGADAEFVANVLEQGMFGQQVVVIGAGLVGAEFAASAKMYGAQVTLVTTSDAPLSRVLGDEMAQALHAEHTRQGVTVLSAPVTELGANYVLVGDERIEADLIVAAIGVEPETTLATKLKLDVDDGIVVDSSQRTSKPQILAIGDAARVRNEAREVHWEAAMEDAANAASTIMGTPAVKRSVPWFWSDRYDTHVEAVGDFSQAKSTVKRLNRRGQLQVLFGLDSEGKLVAASMLDGGLMSKSVKRLIARGVTPERTELEDPAVGPRDLGRQDVS